MSEIEVKLSPDFELDSLHQLHLPVAEISEDFTLYDLFCIINAVEQSYPGLAAIFGMPRFDKFWKQICLDREENSSDDIEYLELYWSISYNTRVDPMTPEEKEEWRRYNLYSHDILDEDNNYWDDLKRGEISNLMGCHGIGDYHEPNKWQWPENAEYKCGYAIEFTSVNNLKHLPLRINNEVSFYQPYVKKGTKLCRTGFVLKQDPTLWTVITSVFWELTFCGFTPEEVAAKSDDLSKACEGAKEIMDKLDKLDPKEVDGMTEDEIERYLKGEE